MLLELEALITVSILINSRNLEEPNCQEFVDMEGEVGELLRKSMFTLKKQNK